MKRSYLAALLALSLAATGATATVYYQSSQKKKNAATQKTLAVKTQDLQITLKTYGIVEPDNRVEVKPIVAGSMDSILVEEGSYVKAGTILGWMSSVERSIMIAAKKSADIYKPIAIVAPINGTLISRNVKPGQTFSSSDSLFSISDSLIVRGQVDEVDITRVKEGQTVEVVLDALPQKTFPAVVKKIGFDAKKIVNVNKYIVDLASQEMPAYARSGMTASLRFMLTEKHGIVAVPKNLVRRENGKWITDILDAPDADGTRKSIQRTLTLGDRTDELVEVTEGLKVGELILDKEAQKEPESTH